MEKDFEEVEDILEEPEEERKLEKEFLRTNLEYRYSVMNTIIDDLEGISWEDAYKVLEHLHKATRRLVICYGAQKLEKKEENK